MLSYWIRWIINVLWSLMSESVSIQEKTTRWSFVNVDQLDLNFHLNNAQYFSALEFSRTDFWLRTGLFSLLRKGNLKTMLGGSTFQFRRELRLFQAYTTTCEIEYIEDRWIFFRQEFWADGKFIGRGLCRIGFVDGKTGKLISAIPIIEKLNGGKLDEKFTKTSKLVKTFIDHDNAIKELTVE
jgi:acyl-CoA thioesterase FadM